MITTIEKLRALTERRAKNAEQWNKMIRELRASGATTTAVGEAAGITPGRVWQIEHHRR